MLEYFNKLSPEEVIKFEKFVISPYHNNNKNVIKLFKYLKSKYPEVNESSLYKKKIFRYIYRVGRYNDTKLRKLISDFAKVLDGFLIQCEVEKYPIRKAMLLLNSLREKNFSKRYGMHIKNTGEIIAENKGKDDSYYLYLTLYDKDLYHYKMNSQMEIDKSLISKWHSDLDYFYIYFRLDSLLNYASMQNLNFKKISFFKHEAFRTVVSMIKNNLSEIKKYHPRIYIKYIGLMMLVDFDNNKNFKFIYSDELEKYFRRMNYIFEKEIMEYCFQVLEKFYIKTTRFDSLNLNYARKLHNFYEFAFCKLPAEIPLWPATYLKAVTNGLLVKEYNWVDNFIGKYKNNIKPKPIKRTLYNLCKANYFFEQKNYVRSISFVNSITFEFYFYNYSSKFLYSQIYFETENFFKLRNEIDNLKKFKKRYNEKLPQVRKNDIMFFIKYITLIMKLKESKSSDKILKADMIKKEMKREKNLPVNAVWFYEKLDEFK